ncbi:MAG: methyltransferase domain-containing protein [Candidatus Aenigmatarchaeota archaeon]
MMLAKKDLKFENDISKLTAEVYDRIANEYEEHTSCRYLGIVQWNPIEFIFRDLSKPNQKDKKILLIGPGTGKDHSQQLNDFCNSINTKNVTLFDISSNMLRKASKYFRGASTVLGDASYLGDYFSDESFDFVLAFLCDHIADQDGFFKGAYKILKKHGVLMTTYPGKEIQHAIRKFIYKTDVNLTRFYIDGKEYFLPSKLYSLKELYKLYKKHGFVDISTSGWSGDDRDDGYIDTKASPTILKACKIIGKCTKIVNLVTMGIGAKEGILFKPDYKDFSRFQHAC